MNILKATATKAARNCNVATGARNCISKAIAKIPTPEIIHERKSFPLTSSSVEIGSM
jgi:hypothetical protein